MSADQREELTCARARAQFSDHLDGTLGPEQEDRLGAHLVRCDSCRAALCEYEATLGALSGASPLPPASLEARIRAASRRHGLLRARWRPSLRALLPLAASLAIFLLGVGLGQRRTPAGATGDVLWTQAMAPPACQADLERYARLDLGALRAPRLGAGERALTVAGRERVRLPASLTSRGPYGLEHELSGLSGGTTCTPLSAAYGDVLLLSTVPLPRSLRPSPASFSVEADPGRVLYHRVRWVRAGTVFVLEGRAESEELLDLAQEIAAKTRT